MPTHRPHDPHLRRDILHSFAVAALACILSLGVVYLVYLVRVLRVARTTPHQGDGDYLLVFGKALVDGKPDDEFERRLARTLVLARAAPDRPVLLLGGGHPLTEAAAGERALRSMGLSDAVPVWLEDQSTDTLENLRNARDLLAAHHRGTVLLLSNRYHLARCGLLARQLGFEHRLCAAEASFDWREQPVIRLLGEAGYLCWLDIGTRWARLIGHRRMLDRVH